MLPLLQSRRKTYREPAEPKKRSLRPDIQGLRALAVVLVIVDHLFKFPAGGFIGVDVFFVISGFVITGSMLREHQRTGKVSFADFYRRRARRILPLALLVLAVTVAASWAIFSTSRALRVTQEGLWSLAFGTNWHLAIVGTDYMQADAVVSPLQHFWSLAVEEQFYVVWPWLIVLLGGLAARKAWSDERSRRLLAVAMVVLIGASFVWAMWETATSPTFAYFSTFSRAWELAAGALLAALGPALRRMSDGVRPVMAYAGLATILAGAFLITPASAFPGPWAAVPVIGTALVIAAGSGGEQTHLAPLTNRVSQYLGDISYSLYLWHFPAIILIGSLLPLESPTDYLTVLAAVLVMSSLSYYFLEDPIRHSMWLEPKSKRHRQSELDVPGRLRVGAVVGLALLTAVVAAAAYTVTSPKPSDQTFVAAPVPSASAVPTAEPTSLEGKLAVQINAALAAQTWPELTPSRDQLGPNAKAAEWVKNGCMVDEFKPATFPGCKFGPGNKTAVLMGDSIAVSYAPAVRAALEPQGYQVYIYVMQQCPAVSVTVLNGANGPHPDCNPFRDWTFQQIKQLQPDLTIMSSLHTAHLASGADGSAFDSEWIAGYKKTFEALAGATGKAVVLDAPPTGKAMDECATRTSAPSACVVQPTARYYSTAQDVDTAAKGMEGKLQIQHVNTKGWYCSANQYCPSFVNNVPVYADGFHLTDAYSRTLGPVLAAALAAPPKI